MFDIGFWEISIIAIVALLVIGPDKLPGVARTAGMWIGRIRGFVSQVKVDIEKEIRADEIKKALERDAGLDELKQIMNTDHLSLEEEFIPFEPSHAEDPDEDKDKQEEQHANELPSPSDEQELSDASHGGKK